MIKLKCWKKQLVKPNRILWTKGKFKPGYGYKDWVHVDDIRMLSTHQYDKTQNFEVGAHNKINSETINGHFKYFNSKKSALNLANKYLKGRNKC